MKWQKKLTKKMMKHLEETTEGRPTLAAFKSNREFQRRQNTLYGMETCWDCREIARRLNLE